MQLSSQPTISRSDVSLWRRLLPFSYRSSPSRPSVVVREETPASNGCILEASGYSDKGCVRPNNEDYFRIEPHLGFYAVADGMGGAEAGEYASRLAVDTVVEHVVSAENRDSRLLIAAMEEANRRVVEAARGSPNLKGMGTTLLAGLALGEEIHITSVGDSRVYVLDDTSFRPITQDQSWMHEVGRFLGLDEESLQKHPMRHVLTMAIGHGTPLTVNNYAIRLNPSTTLLMCTDGLHGVVGHAKIEEILRDSSDDRLEAKCRTLVDAARAAGGPDNISVVLLRLKSNGQEKRLPIGATRLAGSLRKNALRSWRQAPAFARAAAIAVALMATALFYGPTIASRFRGPSLMEAITARATVELSDDFRSGFDAWSAKQGGESTWSVDPSGWVRPGRLALYRDTIPLTDYRLEFMCQIQSRALGFAFRAVDTNNYYAVKIGIVRPGPLPSIALIRYAVINGRAGPKTLVSVPLAVQSDTLYRVVTEVRGDLFSVTLNGQLADAWSDGQFKSGGIGFFTDNGEVSRLRGVHVVDKDDILGRIALHLGQSLR